MEAWLERISPCHRIVGEASHEPGWVEAMRVIYDHELVLFEGGTYAVEFQDESFICQPGSYIIVPPGRRHVTRETAGKPGRRSWIHFDWVYAGDASSLPIMTYSPAKPDEELFREAPSFAPKGVLHGQVERMPVALELFRRIDSLFNMGSGREALVSRGVLLELLLEILASGSEPKKTEDKAAGLASRIRQRLIKLAGEPQAGEASIQRRLEKSGMSYAHQCRVFKSRYGISPLKYVNELRMTRITGLLRDTALPVSEIAAISGFENLGYFSRFFKRSAGMSPREYRRGSEG